MNKQTNAILFSVIICATVCSANAKDSPIEIHSNLLSKRVSLVKLLANPDSFDGKKVFVDGIMHHTYEDNTLYLSRDMADCGVKCNGIGLRFDDKNLSLIGEKTNANLDYFHNKCVAVYGTFSKDGMLENVSVVKENSPMSIGSTKANKRSTHK